MSEDEHENNDFRFSWTLDINTAKFFSNRFPSENRIIHELTVNKSLIVAYFNYREEKRVKYFHNP